MDQQKIGSFLKELRKEKQLTQEQLAEKLGVSGRTVSRWETASNMPDISILVEIAEFYDVSIPEIIDGERKSEKMDQETRETAVKMAEYSHNESETGMRKVAACLITVFGVFLIISALAVFPNESSWGSIYSIFGGMILTIGVYLMMRTVYAKKKQKILGVLGCIVLLSGLFAVSDYLTVTQFHQVPRFSYVKSYSSDRPDEIVHKTLFFTAVQKNPGTEAETVEIVRTGN